MEEGPTEALTPFAPRVPFLSPKAIETQKGVLDACKNTHNSALLHEKKLLLCHFRPVENRSSDKKGTFRHGYCQKKSAGGVTKKGHSFISCAFIKDFSYHDPCGVDLEKKSR
jgi:hypothetical protein